MDFCIFDLCVKFLISLLFFVSAAIFKISRSIYITLIKKLFDLYFFFMKEHNILGVVLAGGKSSRFGSNKSLSMLANNKFIEHVINKIDAYFSEILVISNDKILKLNNQKINIIKDCIKGHLGPLVGVLSAMKYANSFKNKYKWIITFPCDTPFFNKIIIEKMIKN